jgi:hypothetical protein
MVMAKRSRGKNARPSKPKKKKQKVASPAVSEVLVDKAATASTGLSTTPPSDNERGEEQTVAYDPAEDFNERSNVRTELLTRIIVPYLIEMCRGHCGPVAKLPTPAPWRG